MKKGDKVRVISRICGHNFNIGEVVEYIGLNVFGNENFKSKSGGEWVMREQEFEPIKDLEEEKQELEQRLKQINQELEKPKFEIGKWYAMHRDNKTRGVINFQGDLKNKNYGFWDDYWSVSFSLEEGYGIEVRPATHEEVEKALIKEAKKRYEKCIGINYIDTGGSSDAYYLDGFMFNSKENVLFGTGEGEDFSDVIFQNGKWAEIIEEPKVIVNGYEMQQDGDKIIFGCMEFTASRVQSLYKQCKVLGVSEVIVKDECARHHVTIDQLQQIVDNITVI